MFEGFTRQRVPIEGGEINLVRGGDGPPVLLLHGYPQTHAIWHRVAPRLAERFTVVAADLRGYGDSFKPESDPEHAAYSKRAMARDQVAAMEQLGFREFAVVGHDRGGRVGHRMVLDHPDRVTRLAVLDIAPTREMYAATDKAFATAYYHWFFLIQPAPLPERLIGGDPDLYLRSHLARGRGDLGPFAPEALDEYLRCFRDPASIHATCEDYRAAATIDIAHDDADGDHRKVRCPLLCLWGGRGVIERHFDALALWRRRAADVSGRALDCGHYLPEEAPDETCEELLSFLS
jgi:haloacetate dehalogenase